MIRHTPTSRLFPYTTLFRSQPAQRSCIRHDARIGRAHAVDLLDDLAAPGRSARSEEHTSELQSRFELVCRLLLEQKRHREKLLCPSGPASPLHQRSASPLSL